MSKNWDSSLTPVLIVALVAVIGMLFMGANTNGDMIGEAFKSISKKSSTNLRLERTQRVTNDIKSYQLVFPSGTARVYKNNPVSTPNLELVQLEHLDYNGHLQGSYVEVENMIPGESDVYASDNVFIYEPDEIKIYIDGTTSPYQGVRFGESMAYYCSDTLLSYLSNHFGGEFIIPNVVAYVYNIESPGSAGYSLDDDSITTNVPDRNGIDPNKDCSTFTHELFHLFFLNNYYASDDIITELNDVGTIYHAVNEGFVYFLTASFQDVLYQNTEESIISEYNSPTFDCSNSNVLELRYHDIDSDCETAVRCQYNHQAIAGIFWDIREVLGKENTHQLIFESWKYLPKSCQEREGENYLVDVFLALDDAEEKLFNNQNYHDAIKDAFMTHSGYFQNNPNSLPMVTPICN